MSKLDKNCRCVDSTPFGNPLVPDVKKMVALSSGPTSTLPKSLASNPSNSLSKQLNPSPTFPPALTTNSSPHPAPLSFPLHSASAPIRSSSTIATTARVVMTQCATTSGVLKQLTATATAPRRWVAQKARTQSGELRRQSATRAPLVTPSVWR